MPPSWSCRCLNVRIDEQVPQFVHPSRSSPDFFWVFTTPEDVHVTHPELTFRSRKCIALGHGHSIYDIVLSCLLCRKRIYRFRSQLEVTYQFSKDYEGPILDFNEPLVGADGWLEVSTENCMDETAMKEAASSFRWSPNFSLLLPNSTNTPHISAAPPVTEPVYPQMPPTTPLFLPPPFIPADPTFAHLSEYAQTISDNARRQAQAELDSFMRRKVEESLELDRRLRNEVDLIWATWRNAWQEIVAPILSPEQRRSNLNGPSLLNPSSSNNPSSNLPGSGSSLSNSQTQPLSQSRRPEAPISIRDDFDSIVSSTVTGDTQSSTPRSPARSPPAQSLPSLLSEARLSSPPITPKTSNAPSPHPRSPRMPLIRRLSSEMRNGEGTLEAASYSASSPFERSQSLSIPRSPPSTGKILANAATDESRAIAASFQIMMSDSMAPARAAHLARLGLPATYEQEEEEALEDIGPLAHPPGPAAPPAMRTTSSAPQTPKTPKSPSEKKRVSFRPDEESPKTDVKRPSLTSPRKSDDFGIFDLDLNADGEEHAPTNTHHDLQPEEMEEYEAFAHPRVRRPQMPSSRSSSRSGFVGSLLADAHLQKLALGPTAASFAGDRTDWKQVARQKVLEDEARAAAAELEEEARKADEDSPADELSALPAIPIRRRSAPTGSIASSLPIEIHVRRPRTADGSGYTFAPKTSLVDRAGIKVPPLPLQRSTSASTTTNETRPSLSTATSSSGLSTPGVNGNRNRSKSISSVARDRTYAARDVSQMRDPGTALGVPEEEDEDEEVMPIENGIDEDDKGRINTYKILARQADTPDEATWQNVPG